MKNKTNTKMRVGLAFGMGLMIALLGGCNAISGIGKDIQEVSGHTKSLMEGKSQIKTVRPSSRAAVTP